MLRTVTAVSPYGLYKPISIIENIIKKIPDDARGFFEGVFRGITSRKHERFVKRFEAVLTSGDLRPAAIAFLESEIKISYADGMPKVTFSTDYFNKLPRIGECGLRSLFIDGGRDPLFPGFVIRKAALEVPGAEFYSFSKAGHSPQETYPSRFNKLILDFVCGSNNRISKNAFSSYVDPL
jgi:pimeloyl-ACP methyl ester carboxylesterase